MFRTLIPQLGEPETPAFMAYETPVLVSTNCRGHLVMGFHLPDQCDLTDEADANTLRMVAAYKPILLQLGAHLFKDVNTICRHYIYAGNSLLQVLHCDWALVLGEAGAAAIRLPPFTR